MKEISNPPEHRDFPKKTLLVIILFGLLHGLIYVFVIPPWQHYDEPTHFEYAWLIAHHNRLPQRGEFDNQIRREIQVSMYETKLFPDLELAPSDNSNTQPIWIGVSQVGDPPLYYILASFPLRLFSSAPVLTQLYVGRLFSICLFLLMIWVSYLWSIELFRPSPLRWLVPLMVAGLPGLVDLMSAMSSDSAAILVYSIYLLYGIKLIRHGPRLFNLSVFIISLLLCFWTKSSAWIAFLSLPLFLVFFLFSKAKRWIAWFVIGISITVLTVGGLQFDDAAFWFRDTKQVEASRLAIASEEYNGFAFQLVSDPGGYPNALYQSIPDQQIQKLRGQDVTIGVWMWASTPININAPMLAFVGNDKNWKGWGQIYVTPTPIFYTRTIRLPLEPRRISFVLNPFEVNGEIGAVYYYAPFLVPGIFTSETQPEFLNQAKSELQWNGVVVSNLIRNSNAVEIWPRFRYKVTNLAYMIDYRLGDGLAWLIYSLDFEGNSWYIRLSSDQIFQTFWAKFGWGSVRLEGGKPYLPIKLACVLSLIGVVVGFYVRYPKTNKRIIFWLAFSTFLSFAYAWFTGISTGVFVAKGVIPVARFIYPSVLIILSFFCFGWYQAFKWIFPKDDKIGIFVFLVSLIFLDGYALYSIILGFYS